MIEKEVAVPTIGRIVHVYRRYSDGTQDGPFAAIVTAVLKDGHVDVTAFSPTSTDRMYAVGPQPEPGTSTQWWCWPPMVSPASCVSKAKAADGGPVPFPPEMDAYPNEWIMLSGGMPPRMLAHGRTPEEALSAAEKAHPEEVLKFGALWFNDASVRIRV